MATKQKTCNWNHFNCTKVHKSAPPTPALSALAGNAAGAIAVERVEYKGMFDRFRAAITTRYDKVSKWMSGADAGPAFAEKVSKDRKGALRYALLSGVMGVQSAVHFTSDRPVVAGLAAATSALAAAAVWVKSTQKGEGNEKRRLRFERSLLSNEATPPKDLSFFAYGSGRGHREVVDTRAALEEERQKLLQRAADAPTEEERRKWQDVHDFYVAGVRMADYEASRVREYHGKPRVPTYLRPGTKEYEQWHAIDAINQRNWVLGRQGEPVEKWERYPDYPLN